MSHQISKDLWVADNDLEDKATDRFYFKVAEHRKC